MALPSVRAAWSKPPPGVPGIIILTLSSANADVDSARTAQNCMAFAMRPRERIIRISISSGICVVKVQTGWYFALAKNVSDDTEVRQARKGQTSGNHVKRLSGRL
ncbi:hypothetical protein CBM2625_U10011 [Cupriavidus taiwanensis]|nr:hypothetical protein CBM2625_U10011 [Cupriavidus taiwanensis]